MGTRIHTKVTTAIAAAAMTAAVVTPCASADSPKGTRIKIPPALSHLQEPGSTGWLPQAKRVVIPARLAHLQEPGSTGWVPRGVSQQPSVGDLARGDALNKRYHLGIYSSAVQAGPKPEGVTTQQWQAELARGDALNQRYGLGVYAAAAHASTATRAPVQVVNVTAGGFDWGAAVIGAGVVLGLALASAGALMALHRRRTLAHI